MEGRMVTKIPARRTMAPQVATKLPRGEFFIAVLVARKTRGARTNVKGKVSCCNTVCQSPGVEKPPSAMAKTEIASKTPVMKYHKWYFHGRSARVMKPYRCIGHISATPRSTYKTFMNWAWKKASFVVYWLIEILLEIFVAIWA